MERPSNQPIVKSQLLAQEAGCCWDGRDGLLLDRVADYPESGELNGRSCMTQEYRCLSLRASSMLEAIEIFL